MRLTIEEELICSQHMNVNGESHCAECQLYLGYDECYATIDGRGLSIKRYNGIPDGTLIGVKDISKYAGITMYQMVYNRDEIGLPYYTNGKKFYAFKEEIDEWRKSNA